MTLYTFIVDPIHPKPYSVNEPTEAEAREAVAAHVNEQGDYLFTVEPADLHLIATSEITRTIAELAFAENAVDELTDAITAANVAGDLAAKYEALDKIAGATRQRNRLEERLLNQATIAGLDFVTVPCNAYSMNYALEDGRWEPFVSDVAA